MDIDELAERLSKQSEIDTEIFSRILGRLERLEKPWLSWPQQRWRADLSLPMILDMAREKGDTLQEAFETVCGTEMLLGDLLVEVYSILPVKHADLRDKIKAALARVGRTPMKEVSNG